MRGLWDWVCSASKRPYIKYSFNELLREASSLKASEINKANQIKEELTYRKRLKLNNKKTILAALPKRSTDINAANQPNKTQNGAQDLEQEPQSAYLELGKTESANEDLEVNSRDNHPSSEKIQDKNSKREGNAISPKPPATDKFIENNINSFDINNGSEKEKPEKERNEKSNGEKTSAYSQSRTTEEANKRTTKSIDSDKWQEKKDLGDAIRQKVKSKNINELPLSLRVQNCLYRSGIKDTFDLSSINMNSLCELKNFGQKSVIELLECLHKEKLLSEQLRISYEEGSLFYNNKVRDDYRLMPLTIDIGSPIRKGQTNELTQESTSEASKEKNSVQKEEERTRSIDEIADRIKSTLEVIIADDSLKEAIREIVGIQIRFSELKRDDAFNTLTILEEEALSPSVVVIIAKMILARGGENITDVSISPKKLEDEKLIKAVIKQIDKVTVEKKLRSLYGQFIKDALSSLNHQEEVKSIDLKEKISNLVLNQAFHEGSLADVRERAKKIEVANDLSKGFNIMKQRIAGLTLASIGEMNNMTRERIRQIEKGFISRYKLKSLTILAEEFRDKINDEKMSDQIDEIFKESCEIPATGNLSILSNRVETYRYFYCPIPSTEYYKHLTALEALTDRKIIGAGYWDVDGFNLRGTLWAFSAKSNSFGLMPKQLTLPRCVSAAVQRFGGQAAVANKIGMKYQGQIRGTDGRTYWDKDKIREYINKVQNKYFLPDFLMPDKQQLRGYIDEKGNEREKGNSCISAITNQYTLEWTDAAKSFGLKAYESCTDDDSVETKIIWNILNNAEVEARDHIVKQIWRGEDKLRRTELLMNTYGQICAIGEINASTEQEFIKVVRNSRKKADEGIIDDIADMLF